MECESQARGSQAKRSTGSVDVGSRVVYSDAVLEDYAYALGDRLLDQDPMSHLN